MVATTKKFMTWLITGGSGQLARCLKVTLDRESENSIFLSRRELDISKEDSISAILELQPSVIINCAAYTAVDRAESEPAIAFAINTNGASNVARAAKALAVPIVHISTDYVFSGEGTTPWKTDSLTEPTSIYGRTKLSGEKQIQEIYPEQSFVLRTAWLYSEHGANFAKSILRKCLNGNEPIKVVDDQIGQPTSASELADKILCLVKAQAIPGIYHVTNKGEASWFQFAYELILQSGYDPSRVTPIKSVDYPTLARRPAYSVLDNSKWDNLGLPVMSSWEVALKKSIPEIVERVESEARDE